MRSLLCFRISGVLKCVDPSRQQAQGGVINLQDGVAIKPSERIAAQQALPHLQQQLHQELLADGLDPEACALVEDDSLDIENVQENGLVFDKTSSPASAMQPMHASECPSLEPIWLLPAICSKP